jgi:hypothetical protein
MVVGNGVPYTMRRARGKYGSNFPDLPTATFSRLLPRRQDRPADLDLADAVA